MAIFKPVAKFVSFPVHVESDANFLWRIKGHSDKVVLVPGIPPKYRAATKADVTT